MLNSLVLRIVPGRRGETGERLRELGFASGFEGDGVVRSAWAVGQALGTHTLEPSERRGRGCGDGLMSAPSGITQRIRDDGGDDVGPRLHRQSVLVSAGPAGSHHADQLEPEPVGGGIADLSSDLSPEPEFYYAQMIEQVAVHALFPFSLPYMLSRGGPTRCRNQMFLPYENTLGAVYAVVAYNWLPPLFFWAVACLDLAAGAAIGQMESDRHHPLFAIVVIVNFARWAMVSAKYGYLTPAEYQHVLHNTDHAAQANNLRTLQLLTSWNEPSRAQLSRELEASQERLGLCIDGLEFVVGRSGAPRLAAFLQETTDKLTFTDDGINLTCDSGITKLPCPDTRQESSSSPEEPNYAVKAELLLLAVYEKAVSEESWNSYRSRALVIGLVCGLLVLPASAFDSVFETGLATADGTASSSPQYHNVTLGGSAILSAVSSQGAVFWTHRCLVAVILAFHLRLLWMWFFVALVDYRRKSRIMNRMGSLIAPSLSVRHGVATVDPVLPLTSSDDVFAWLVCRRLLQNMGRMYQLRAQLLTGYIMIGLVAVFTLLVLSVLMSGRMILTPSVLKTLFGAYDVGRFHFPRKSL
eukprot:COSAG03_NODE_111_length_12507_cov_28.124355_4_plen_583_part_00